MEADQMIIMWSEGGTVRLYMNELTLKEAIEICEESNWEYVDENNFVWQLGIEDMGNKI